MRVKWISRHALLGREGFPHLVFYVEAEAETDVWRVLHGARDISAWMRESGEE